MQLYTLPTANAEFVARALQEAYKDAPNVHIKAAGHNAIVVYAPPEDQAEIAYLLGR